MVIGVPKEIKNNEYRIALTPAGAKTLTAKGHKVLIEKNAGLNSGISDSEFTGVGALIIESADEVYRQSDMIVKVKEPLPSEYELIKKDQLVFTFFHFASSETLTKAMIENGSTCIAYETVEKSDYSLPILVPMSEVAGRMSVQQGAKYLEKPFGGRGVLLGGVPGVKPANVIILGGGVVGTQAAKMAAGLGADVIIMDISPARLRYLSDILPANVKTELSNEYNIVENLKFADLVIGAVLVPGAKAPKLITKEMLSFMKPGSVIVDVAVDQGGCIETCKPTTHDNPVYTVNDIQHYCVANIPGAVPHTSTRALTNITLPYIVNLADKGWEYACTQNNELKKGLNIVQGKVVYQGVAEAFNLPYIPVEDILK
ncbi:alanine dehydrogenase [Cytophagaceae bacterium ABcell3]|nr:alanine dehydrogenase [Cytophagaceae bacterium ABcell3]